MPSPAHSLPHEAADRFTRALTRFLALEAAAGVLLLVATVVALVVSNTTLAGPMSRFWELPVGVRLGSLDLTRSLRHVINDGLMTVFFFVVALELKREIVHGELRSFRMAAFSFAGAIGGMVVPAAAYVALVHGRPGADGWGTVMATDTAFVIGGLALLGSRVPTSLRLFLLSLAIFDDVGAILVVAIGYGDSPSWPALLVAGGLVAMVLGMAWLGVRSMAVYGLLGVALWAALDASGIHPTLAGVVLGLMTPAREWVSGPRLHAIFERVLARPELEHRSRDNEERAELRRAGVAAREATSPVERLEARMHPWSAFAIMPLFALANAGVRISWTGIDRITLAVFVGLVVGKPVGVLAFSWLAVRMRLATRPAGSKWSFVAAGSMLTGIGFTMSLFIAGLAFDATLLSSAKIGILAASTVAGTAGLLTLTWLTSKRRVEDSNAATAHPTGAVLSSP